MGLNRRSSFKAQRLLLSQPVGISACVPNSTYVSIRNWQHTGMPKSEMRGTARKRHDRYRAAGLPNVIEGQMAEICRDLAIQTKRMRQLQEQADELRMVISQWSIVRRVSSKR